VHWFGDVLSHIPRLVLLLLAIVAIGYTLLEMLGQIPRAIGLDMRRPHSQMTIAHCPLEGVEPTFMAVGSRLVRS